ncbi:AraC family transcriptional regulator [Parasalinivibrio latis]|uniref:AraC family transcriptional regulator n=1 Tax=Parasalinivibrio latis TaxID=2952610 RepID=UPI0030DDE408
MDTENTRLNVRLQDAVNYIENHLSNDLSLNTLSGIACLSPYHFHRCFKARYGITSTEFIRLVKLKQAANRLAFRVNDNLVDISMDAGYTSQEAFSRAFKQYSGQTPGKFRAQPEWEQINQRHQPASQIRSKDMEHHTFRDEDVTVMDFPAVQVGLVIHRGAPHKLANTLRQFINWRRDTGLHPSKSRTFNLLFDDPASTPPENYRFGLAAEVFGPVGDNDFDVSEAVIPGGRCAVIRHIGSDDTLALPVTFLYGEWLAKNRESPRDFPLFLERVTFFPDVPEAEMVTDIYLPLAY